MEHMKTYVEQWYPVMLETIKKMQDINLSKPHKTMAANGSMTEVKKLSSEKGWTVIFVNQVKIDKEKKQFYAIFYGQMHRHESMSLGAWQLGGCTPRQESCQTPGNVAEHQLHLPEQSRTTSVHVDSQKQFYETKTRQAPVSPGLLQENSVHEDAGLLDILSKEYFRLTTDERKAYAKEGQERMLAMKMLMGAEQLRTTRTLTLWTKTTNFPRLPMHFSSY